MSLPDAVLRYADHADGVLDVHLPPGRPTGPLPLVVMVHGGFWRAAYDRVHTRPLTAAIAAEGFVVVTPEYRRVGTGGGWPATFEDVSAAMGALPDLLAGLGVQTAGTTVVGHSAGGHLALLLAPRRDVDRVVALAPVGHLRGAFDADLGDGAVRDFLGTIPADDPGAYDEADPAVRLRQDPGCEVVVLHGTADDAVPVTNSRALVGACPQVRLVELDDVDHFAPIDPLSAVWPVVLGALRGTG